ncbi:MULTISPECIES: hypothetical protein [unclassified Bradyrhizobium]|uniref:hypothetical protein n=1 Tax=unclassified Bradyrhizobium TaxID=2631580 RepID=UPI00024D1D61|nr:MULTISPECIES: hypothetical protein [Bradyrhizobium]EHR01592.1 hypothetical protein Bra471DRAFT_02330 [Bradyrhizobium sp. WSM471]UFW43638.1 hypothetical protein BcanWSM471_11450 [Bradyrhizobium canariense]
MHNQPVQRQLKTKSFLPAKQQPLVRGDALRSVTIGFPAQVKHEPKRVHFDPPLRARLVGPDEGQSTECEVTTVWDAGAQLRVKDPPPAQFVLQFAWAPTVVARLCRRTRCNGEEVWVEYIKQPPCYSMKDDQR